MPRYQITIDGATYEVSSPTPLTDTDAYGLAKTQHESSGGNFSPAPATKNQGPPDPWADLRATGERLINEDRTPTGPKSPPTPGMDGFLKGLSGNDSTSIVSDDPRGLGALSDAFTAEHAGGVARDLGIMGAGALIPGGLKAGGKGLEAAGTAMGSGPGALAMRSMAGHAIGGTPGAVAAAVTPPMLRGFGRVMQRTGEAMSSSPEPPPPQMPQILDLGNVPDYTDLGNAHAPAPRPPPAQLNAAPSGPFPAPPSSAAPRGMMGPAPASASVPPPSLASEQQAAMLDAVHGPAPLGSLPASQSPRVLSWKPGFGPSAGDAATLREAYGSKTAGTLLKARGDQIKTLAPTDGPAQLPAHVSDSLGQQFLAASPEVRQQMLSAASPLVRSLFQSLAERSP